MQIDFFTQNVNNPSVLIPCILKEWHTYYERKAFEQYYPQFHKVNSLVHRPKKVIVKPDPDAPVKADGTQATKTIFQDLNRVSLALQKLIVSRKAAFVTGGDLSLNAKPITPQEEELYNEVLSTWKKNKLQFKNTDIFKRMASETECAEIWYSDVKDRVVSMKMNVYSPSMGFDLVPVFDNLRDLIAFGLKYEKKSDTTTTNHLDLYDAERILKYVQTPGNTWQLESTIEHNYGKIPVIYYGIIAPVWTDVQNMIERLEILMSNFADTNDYNGSPILFAEGVITGWADKGETGKVIQGEGGAKLSYVNWDSAPEAIRMEIEKLTNFIHTITQTPDISFAEMKGLGDISGAAWDRLMIDAHLNAIDYHNGVYGEGIQRRINFLKSALVAINSDLTSAIDLDITPVFGLFKLDSEVERIDTAMKANGGLPVMSQKESIQYVGLSDDADKTISEIKSDAPVPAPTA